MRIVKNADERKSEILDTASKLFTLNGYDNTSINDIIKKIGIAKGTVFYHFKSKEDMLDALIERACNHNLNSAKEIADDKSVPVLERLLKTLTAFTAYNNADLSLADNLQKPQNALMHQKTHGIMLSGITPILTGIIEDGISEGLFNTPYPYETVEMIVSHVTTVFDDNFMSHLSSEEHTQRVEAFILNTEILLGAEPGSLAPMIRMLTSLGRSGMAERRKRTERKTNK